MEVWRAVVGYEGLYEVSSEGRVRGLDRQVWNKGRRVPGWQRIRGTIKQPWAGGPYPLVRLCKSGVKFTVPVYRLVAEAFLGPPPTPRHEVCHREGVSAGDQLSNLYWGTRKENMANAARHGTTLRGTLKFAKLKPEDVLEIRKLWDNTNIKLEALAARYNVSTGAISMAARGVTWRWL